MRPGWPVESACADSFHFIPPSRPKSAQTAFSWSLVARHAHHPGSPLFHPFQFAIVESDRDRDRPTEKRLLTGLRIQKLAHRFNDCGQCLFPGLEFTGREWSVAILR